MELKLDQELSIIYQDLLFLFFLDLSMAYDTMDRERLIVTLEGYGAGPCLCGLLDTFWDHQKVVHGKNGPAFPSTWLSMQGGLVSPALFKVVVDKVIQIWLAMTVED